VENASFIPWLTATAFLHSVMVQERRGLLKLWNLNLIVATFALTILGTFLTRSGVLSSVHAFSEGPIGLYFLGFIAVVLVTSFAIVAGNSERLRPTGSLEAAVSRESVFLLNNLFLSAFTVTVLVGTLFPLVAEAIRGVKVSVGEPFFNRMTLPICVALLFLMGVGPALPWRVASPEVMRRQLLPPAVAALAGLVISLIVACGRRTRSRPSRSARSRSRQTCASSSTARRRGGGPTASRHRWRWRGWLAGTGGGTVAISRTSACSRSR
jgi:cytochrome c-type biogenesis protein CcmF